MKSNTSVPPGKDDKNMPDYTAIQHMMLTEVIEAALEELRNENAEAKRLNKVIADVSQQIHDNPNIDNATKEYLDEYRTMLTLLSGKEHRALYIQGAKDVVDLLRMLKVVK